MDDGWMILDTLRQEGDVIKSEVSEASQPIITSYGSMGKKKESHQR